MSAPVLVHLIEPAAWRSALSAGAVRPDSSATRSVVHLSTPEQVHLPAERLYPGRSDLVLLVVDPARLTDEVRWEPGVPTDPVGMRFPHVYGPLPVRAVVAVVPFRPPAQPVVPAPDDLLGRALAYQLSSRTRRAAEVRDVPGGVAVLDRRFPNSYDDNRLLLSSPVDAETVATAARDLPVRRPAATLSWPDAADVARALVGQGWEASELLLMGRAASALSGGDRAEVVSQEEVHPLWERSWENLGLPADVAAELVAREYRNDEVVAVSDIVVKDGPRVAAAGQLRVDGATAAVDSVLTDPAARGRGYADAVLARALTLAAEAGCDLVVLEALADDWPRQWYARRGFAELRPVWEVTAPTPAERAS